MTLKLQTMPLPWSRLIEASPPTRLVVLKGHAGFACRQPARPRLPHLTTRWQNSGTMAAASSTSLSSASRASKAAAVPAKALRTSLPSESSGSKGKKFIFPRRLLVYHAGTGRTVFIGCTKVSTFLVFGFFCVVLAPAYYYGPDEPMWMVPLIMTAGAIPMLYVGIATKPFVAYVHLLLPDAARSSREALTRWVNAAGRDVRLDLTSMRFSGFARTTRELRLGDLQRRRPATSSAGVSNISVRTSHAAVSAAASRRSLSKPSSTFLSLFGAPRRFHVGEGANHAPEPRLWAALRDRIPVEEAAEGSLRKAGSAAKKAE